MESVLRFGEGGQAGWRPLPSEDRGKKARRSAMILLNTGANHHIGSGRTMVEHARFLAEEGYATLRMDCLGIGDLAWLPEGPLAVIHHEERAADVSQAVDALEAAGFDDISAAGVCSGAFLAFRCALNDDRIKRLLLVNPQFWLPLSSKQLADARQGSFASLRPILLRRSASKRGVASSKGGWTLAPCCRSFAKSPREAKRR